jgi:hypothetical protein
VPCNPGNVLPGEDGAQSPAAIGALHTVHNAECLLVQFEGYPVHFISRLLLQASQEPVIVIVMLLSIRFPVSDKVIMSLVVGNHPGISPRNDLKFSRRVLKGMANNDSKRLYSKSIGPRGYFTTENPLTALPVFSMR